MKSELIKVVEAQKKISKLNDDIFERKLKIENLEKIKDNKQLFIIEYHKDRYIRSDTPFNFGSRYHDEAIKSIKIYNSINTDHYDTVSADITRYFMSKFAQEDDFLYKVKYMIINENDPLWDILTTDYIKKLEESNEMDKAQIEEIKKELNSEGEE